MSYVLDESMRRLKQILDEKDLDRRDQSIRKLKDALDQLEEVRYQEADQTFNEQAIQLLNDGFRGSGRTTAEVLLAASRALTSPGRWITVGEGDCHTETTETLQALIEMLCHGMGLTLDMDTTNSVLRIKSPLSRLWSREATPEI